MKITIVGRNLEITPGLREVTESKLRSRLERYFDPAVEARVTMNVEKERQIIEVTIPFNGVILRAEEESKDMYKSLDFTIDKLEGQIRKQKTKLQRRKINDSLKFQFIEELKDEKEEEFKIVRTKKFAIKPMSTEEAILQMELVAHNFFVYQNAETDEVNVVYKRKDGNYGLIEPEF